MSPEHGIAAEQVRCHMCGLKQLRCVLNGKAVVGQACYMCGGPVEPVLYRGEYTITSVDDGVVTVEREDQ